MKGQFIIKLNVDDPADIGKLREFLNTRTGPTDAQPGSDEFRVLMDLLWALPQAYFIPAPID